VDAPVTYVFRIILPSLELLFQSWERRGLWFVTHKTYLPENSSTNMRVNCTFTCTRCCPIFCWKHLFFSCKEKDAFILRIGLESIECQHAWVFASLQLTQTWQREKPAAGDSHNGNVRSCKITCRDKRTTRTDIHQIPEKRRRMRIWSRRPAVCAQHTNAKWRINRSAKTARKQAASSRSNSSGSSSDKLLRASDHEG
jgi:hypothetical protein